MDPNNPNIFEILQNHYDPFFSFLDKSRVGEDNQLYYFCQLIARIFLLRFLSISETSPPTPLATLMQNHKRGILSGMRFSFDEFHTLCDYS